ncbi:MAG: hypothetical protein IGS23_14025 [Rivularia sp. T60_A2020_040]|nr:hypothetical protein [Rivularia sp. T60_A2020_040]
MPKKKPIDNIPIWYDRECAISYTEKKEVPKNLINTDRIEYWDSLLEFKTYNALLSIFDKSEILRQQNLILFPACDYFKAWTWNIDFIINKQNPIYIEVKGKWIIDSPKLNSFWHTLKVCQTQKPDIFDRLLLIGKDEQWKIPATNIIVYPLKELRYVLQGI